MSYHRSNLTQFLNTITSQNKRWHARLSKFPIFNFGCIQLTQFFFLTKGKCIKVDESFLSVRALYTNISAISMLYIWPPAVMFMHLLFPDGLFPGRLSKKGARLSQSNRDQLWCGKARAVGRPGGYGGLAWYPFLDTFWIDHNNLEYLCTTKQSFQFHPFLPTWL